MDVASEDIVNKNLYEFCHAEDLQKLQKAHIDREYFHYWHNWVFISHPDPSICLLSSTGITLFLYIARDELNVKAHRLHSKT